MVLSVSACSYCRINVLTRHIFRLVKKVCGHKSEMWIFITHMWIWMPKFCANIKKCSYAIVRESCAVKSWNCKFWAVKIQRYPCWFTKQHSCICAMTLFWACTEKS